MDTTQWFVTVGGIMLIVLTLWFFFGKRGATPPADKPLDSNRQIG